MEIGTWRDKALFTPGPLTTSRTVKQAMLRDLGSRDTEFVGVVRAIRQRLVGLAEASEPDYTAVLVQGSGTFGIEATLGSVIPPDGKLVVLVNGAYGARMVAMAEVLRIPVAALTRPEDCTPDLDALDRLLAEDRAITHVAAVHCETTTGLINPVEEIAAVVNRHARRLIVDAMSSFGAYRTPVAAWGIDYLVSSSNKCIEGVPGFSFVLARTAGLQATRGFARSLSLDLLAQLEGLERDGQFRFTPPTHALLAFHQALRELDAEGGIEGRRQRYARNYRATLDGLTAMGFRAYLRPELQGCIITTFLYPDHPSFSFPEFYRRLSARGHVIYPGKLTQAECFRIGHIGRLEIGDVHALLAAIADVLVEMGVRTG
jgi:2-aminoethylphosphonate-pyruvate transaminase